jgi:hypothetical protein
MPDDAVPTTIKALVCLSPMQKWHNVSDILVEQTEEIPNDQRRTIARNPMYQGCFQ